LDPNAVSYRKKRRELKTPPPGRDGAQNDTERMKGGALGTAEGRPSSNLAQGDRKNVTKPRG